MKFLSDILAKAGLTVDGVVTLNNTATGQTPDANDNSTKLATTAWVRTFVQPYSLPIATASILGGIKVGSGLSIDSGTGVLSATSSGGPLTSFRSEYLITATAGQTTFTVPNGYTPGKIDLFLNGVYLNDTTYTATNSSTVVLDDPAVLDDILTIFVYSTYYVGESPSARTTTYFTATNNQTVFTVPYVIGQVDIFYNGSKLEPSDYTANNGTSITLTNPCNTGDIIEVVNWAVGGGIAATRTITIDGVTQDLSANRTWNILPTGGATGEILAKTSATNYAVAWIPNYTSQIQHYVKLGEAMTIGTAVYVSGTTGNAGTNMIVSKASNASEPTSSKTIGLLASSGAQNDIVFVVTEGLVSGIDTSTAVAGDPVWLGVNGQLIYGLLNKPNAPQHLVFIGVVTRVQQINGEIFVKVQNGFELHELHNVSALNPADGDMIKYVASTGLWTKIAATTTNISEGTNLYYTPARSRTAISLTTSGTSGAATYDNTTGVINIPQYQPALSGTGFVKISGSTISYDNSTYALDSVVVKLTGSQSIAGVKTFTDRISVGATSSLSSYNANFGTLYLQSYLVNNAWFGDNVYYNGSNFIRVATGFTGAFYFQGPEGQFRFGASGAAGTSVGNGTVTLKTNLDGSFAVGNLSTATSNYTGYTFYIAGSTGAATFTNTVNINNNTGGAGLSMTNTAAPNITGIGSPTRGMILNGLSTTAAATGASFYFYGAKSDYTSLTSGDLLQVTNNDAVKFRLDYAGAATFSSSVTANATSTFSNASSLSAIFSNGGSPSNYNSIELRGGTAGTAVNWQISKDNSTGNAFELAPSTTVGGTTYGSPVLKILNTGAATFSSSVTAQTNLGVINANASQAGFVADYTGAGALKVSFSTYNDIMNIYNETNSYSLLNFTRSTKNLVLNPTGENVTVNTTNTGASGISINNQQNLSFSEGSGESYVNVFRQRNSAALVMGAGYKRSVTGAFASSFSSAMARAAIAIGYNNGSIVFFTDTSSTVANGTDIAPTERVTILNNGNTGFGTINPTQKLEVKGNIRLDSRSKVDTGEIDNITFTKDRPDASTGTYEMGAIRSFTYGGYAGGLTFYSGRHTGNGNYGLIPIMTIGSTADIGLTNLGVGTTAPVGKLTVQTTGADGLVMESDLGSVNNSGRLFFKSTVQTYGLFNNSADLRFTYDAIPGNTSGTSLARFANTGKYFRMEAGTGGVQFQGNTGASNALNAYEEGTWTPSILGATGESTYPSNRLGWYTRVGRLVTITWFVSITKNNMTGTLRMSGFPFTLLSGGAFYPQGTVLLDSLAVATNNITFQGANNSTSGDFIGGNGSTSSHTGLPVSVLGSGTMECRGTLTYFTA